MNERIPRVFIGSSSEGVPVAETVQVALAHSCEVVPWWQGVFTLGEGTLESLVNRLGDFDFAVIVLTADDLIESRGEVRQSPRDNALLELGMFIGHLGRHRTFALVERDSRLKLPSDLAGVTMESYRLRDSGSSLGAACSKIKRAIRELGVAERTDRTGADAGRRHLQSRATSFWDLLSDRIFVLFGADTRNSTKREQQGAMHPGFSSNDLSAAFRVVSYLSSMYPSKEIIPLSADVEALPALLSRKGDIVLIGGFVSNVEFARLRENLESKHRLRMGRICRVPEQHVYHPEFAGYSRLQLAAVRTEPLLIESMPSKVVAVDHATVRSYRARVYDVDRRVVTIAGIKGTATVAAAGYLSGNNEILRVLADRLDSKTDIELVISSSFRDGVVESTSLAEVFLDGEVCYENAERVSAQCELGRSCDGCDFGLTARPLGDVKHFFQAVIFDLDDTLLLTYDMLIRPLEMRAAVDMLRTQENLGSSTPVSAEDLADLILKLRKDAPSRLVEELKKAHPEVSREALAARMRVERAIDPSGVRVRSDHLMLLRVLSQRYFLFLLSEGDRQLQMSKVKSLGIARFFQDVNVTKSGSEAGKRNAMQDIVEGYGFDHQRVVVVGNRCDREIRFGNELGLTTVWVSVGEGSGMSFSSDIEVPDFHIQDLSQLEYALVMLKGRAASAGPVIGGDGLKRLGPDKKKVER